MTSSQQMVSLYITLFNRDVSLTALCPMARWIVTAADTEDFFERLRDFTAVSAQVWRWGGHNFPKHSLQPGCFITPAGQLPSLTIEQFPKCRALALFSSVARITHPPPPNPSFFLSLSLLLHLSMDRLYELAWRGPATSLKK